MTQAPHVLRSIRARVYASLVLATLISLASVLLAWREISAVHHERAGAIAMAERTAALRRDVHVAVAGLAAAAHPAATNAAQAQAQVRAVVDSLSGALATQMTTELRATDDAVSKAARTGLVGVAAAWVLGVVLMVGAARKIIRNIRWLSDSVLRLGEQGDADTDEYEVATAERAPADSEFAPLHTAVATARAQLHGLLRRAELERDRSRAIVDATLPAVLVVDRGGRILLTNPSASSMLLRTREQLMGQLLSDLFAPESLRILQDADGTLDCSRAIAEPRFRTRVRVHGARGFAAEVAVVALPADVAQSWAIFISDETAEYAAVRALEEARVVAESASRAKSVFLARMSHELRTPLNSIIGFAKIVRRSRDGVLGDRERMYLERVQAGGEHLLTLVNDILDLSKIEAGKIDLLLERADVGRIVREVAPMFEAQVADRPVTLIVDVPDAPAYATIDVVRTRQVLVNLIGNAIKFTPRGTVRVVLRTDASSERALTLSVADTGIGIPVERQARIFEAFEQADRDTSHRYGGTGLGLAIARQIVEQMGGRLSVESMPGVGSTFSVSFALARGRTPVRPLAAVAGAA